MALIPDFLFFIYYKNELRDIEVNPNFLVSFKLEKHGWNMAGIIRESCTTPWRKYKGGSKRNIMRVFFLDFINVQEYDLDGEGLMMFAKDMNVRLPRVEHTKLGMYF